MHKIQNPACNSFLKLLPLTTVPSVMNDNQIITDGQKTCVSLVLPQSSVMEDWGGLPLKHRNSATRLVRQLPPPFSNCQDFEVLLTRFCALAFGSEKVGQTYLPVTKHPGEWQLYLFSSVSHTHTRALACGQCTDVITDIPGCYLFFIPLEDAYDKWYHK